MSHKRFQVGCHIRIRLSLKFDWNSTTNHYRAIFSLCRRVDYQFSHYLLHLVLNCLICALLCLFKSTGLLAILWNHRMRSYVFVVVVRLLIARTAGLKQLQQKYETLFFLFNIFHTQNIKNNISSKVKWNLVYLIYVQMWGSAIFSMLIFYILFLSVKCLFMNHGIYTTL